MENCPQHQDMVVQLTKIEVIIDNLTKNFNEVKERMVTHIVEGEKPGGIRERVHDLELLVKRVQTEMWKVAIVSAFIGSLVGQLTPDVVRFIINLFM